MTGQTVEVAPRARGVLSDVDRAAIEIAQGAVATQQEHLEKAVLDALANGASVRAITAATGIAGSTIQRWVNKRR